MSTIYILSWDCYGLEACVNASKIDQAITWAALKDEPTSRLPNLNHIVTTLTLRARFNHQRFYEIYSIEVEDGIDEEDIRQMFNDDPQGSAELIRKRGTKLYSDRRLRHEKVVIT